MNAKVLAITIGLTVLLLGSLKMVLQHRENIERIHLEMKRLEVPTEQPEEKKSWRK